MISDLKLEVGIGVVFGSARFTYKLVSELGLELWYPRVISKVSPTSGIRAIV